MNRTRRFAPVACHVCSGKVASQLSYFAGCMSWQPMCFPGTMAPAVHTVTVDAASKDKIPRCQVHPSREHATRMSVHGSALQSALQVTRTFMYRPSFWITGQETHCHHMGIHAVPHGTPPPQSQSPGVPRHMHRSRGICWLFKRCSIHLERFTNSMLCAPARVPARCHCRSQVALPTSPQTRCTACANVSAASTYR